jgi:hypothetical protein
MLILMEVVVVQDGGVVAVVVILPLLSWVGEVVAADMCTAASSWEAHILPSATHLHSVGIQISLQLLLSLPQNGHVVD